MKIQIVTEKCEDGWMGTVWVNQWGHAYATYGMDHEVDAYSMCAKWLMRASPIGCDQEGYNF